MKKSDKSGLSRRTLLKGSAAFAGFVGTQAVTGFPAVHADEPITLRYLSTATNQSPAMRASATATSCSGRKWSTTCRRRSAARR